MKAHFLDSHEVIDAGHLQSPATSNDGQDDSAIDAIVVKNSDATTGGRITGRILPNSNRGIRNCCVYALNGGIVHTFSECSPDGYFLLHEVESGDYTLMAVAESGFAIVPFRVSSELPSGRPRGSVDIQMSLVDDTALNRRLLAAAPYHPLQISTDNVGIGTVPAFPVDISPDGKLVAVGSYDGVVQLWKADTGSPVGREILHDNPIDDIAFSRDGKRVITVCGDEVHLWDVETTAAICPPIRHSGFINAVTLSVDGQHILTTTAENLDGIFVGDIVREWSIATGSLTKSFQRIPATVIASYSGPNGKLAVSRQGNDFDFEKTSPHNSTLVVWDLETSSPIGIPIAPNAFTVDAVFSPNGEKILVSTIDGTIQEWGIRASATKANLTSIGTSLVSTSGVAYDSDGGTISVGGADGVVRFVDSESGNVSLTCLGHSFSVMASKFSADGKRLVTIDNHFVTRVWNVAALGPFEAAPEIPGRIVWAEMGRKQNEMLTISSDCVLRNWDNGSITTETKPFVLEDNEDVLILKRIVGTDRVPVIVSARKHAIDIFDLRSNTVVSTFPTRMPSTAIEIDHEGRKILAGDPEGNVHALDSRTGLSAGPRLIHESPVKVIQLAPGGHTLATVTELNILRLWDMSSNSPREMILEQQFPYSCLTFNADGSVIVVGTYTGLIQAWDTQRGKSIGAPLNYRVPLNGVFVTDDNQTCLGISRSWIHRSELSETGFNGTNSRMVFPISTQNPSLYCHDPTGLRISTVSAISANVVKRLEVSFDESDSPPIQGDATEMLSAWQNRLALEITDNGELRSAHPD
jgi:WD40 repeat protein